MAMETSSGSRCSSRSLRARAAEDTLEDRDKLNEIVMDLILERGRYTFADLIAAVRAEGFSEDTKAIFKIHLDLLGIKEQY